MSAMYGLPPAGERVKLPEVLSANRCWRSFFGRVMDCDPSEGIRVDTTRIHADSMSIRRWAVKLRVKVSVHERKGVLYVVPSSLKCEVLSKPPQFSYTSIVMPQNRDRSTQERREVSR